MLKSQVRGSDVACRYGGEKFVLNPSGASLDGARQKAENIRFLVKSLDLRYHDHPLGMITASPGVALFPGYAGEVGPLSAAADAARYEAKTAGRDRVVVSEAIVSDIAGVSGQAALMA